MQPHQPQRIEPQLPPWAFRTYAIAADKLEHWRPAWCAEVGCLAYLNGWRTQVDEGTDLGRRQAAYIRSTSGRGYTEARDPSGLTLFTFEAGQSCFRGRWPDDPTGHRVRTARPEDYTVRQGDHRGGPLERVHTSPADWVDDFATHQEQLAAARERG